MEVLILLGLAGALAFGVFRKKQEIPGELPPGLESSTPSMVRELTAPKSGVEYTVSTWPPTVSDHVFVFARQKSNPDVWIKYWLDRNTQVRKLYATNVPSGTPDRAAILERLNQDFLA